MRVLIVGGGIAGLAAGIALRRVGHEVLVLERRGAPGAGSVLTLAPNGLRAARALGVAGAVVSAGVPTDESLLLGATGARLGVVSQGVPLEDGSRASTLHRADLQSILRGAAEESGVEVRDGVDVSGVGPGEVRTDGGAVRADLVVGADGIRSAVRRSIDPAAPAPRYVGLTNFGGITRGTPLVAQLRPRAWTMVFGHRAFWAALPTPTGDVLWFVNVPEAPIPEAVRRATSARVWRERLIDLVQSDAGPGAELIATGELELAGDSTYDLPAVPVWRRGRAVLVGDSAHAPSPSSGQGAAMALEDAVVLARHLERTPDLDAALDAFVAERRPRAERIVAAGARSSSTKIPGRFGRRVQEAIMPFVLRRFASEDAGAWMTGFDPATSAVASR